MKTFNHNWKIATIAAAVFALDQLTKVLMVGLLDYGEEKVIIAGFFKFVLLGNTGAAWSMFQDNNTILTLIGLVALVILVLIRHHFDIHNWTGQISLGLVLGGILGNIMDRIRVHHVIDFLNFYVLRRDGSEASFPAFNIADTAICTGVGLLFLMSLRAQPQPQVVAEEDRH